MSTPPVISLAGENQARSWLNRIKALAWLLLLLPALSPLFRPGFFVSDDGRFHVYRMAALADAWRHGVLHPRLFPDFGFGYGQAVLNFYSPLSYWPGALLSFLGMSPAVAAQWTVGLGFVLAALAAYGYVRSLWGHNAGVLAALIYTYLPYHLADAYTRGALPEHMAFIFPPLILWAYTAAFRAETRQDALRPLLWGALAWAGLVLTHNLTTLLMALAAVPHLLLLALWTRRWQRLPLAGFSLLLAMALSAGYWLPVLLESQFMGIGGGPSRGYENHLLGPAQLILHQLVYPYRNGQATALVYPLSWLTPLVLISGLAVWIRRRGQSDQGALLAYHGGLVLAAVAMTTTLSLPLWHPLTPLLGHLQYPWRFLMLVAVGLLGPAALVAQPLGRVRSVLWMPIATILLSLIALPNLPLKPLELPAAQVWSPVRMWQEDAEAGQVGATWTGEFLPVTVAEQRWALGRPREDAVDGPLLDPPPQIQVTGIGYAQMEATVETKTPFTLRLHQFAQPGWNAWIDDMPASIRATDELGLVSVDVPAGTHRIRMAFGETWPRRAGSGLAVLALIGWVGMAWRRRESPALRMTAGFLLACGLVLALNGLGIGRSLRAPAPVQARLDDAALLVGYESKPARGERALDVTLYWFALRDMGGNVKAFVHLLDGAGQVVGQHDGDPVGGFTPTSRWRAGEIIADTHRIALPPGVPPGEYSLKAGLYEPATVTNLAVQPATPDNRVALGTVEIEE
jgi:hypothetical protein